MTALRRSPEVEFINISGNSPGIAAVTAAYRNRQVTVCVETKELADGTWQARRPGKAWSPPCETAQDALGTQVAVVMTARSSGPSPVSFANILSQFDL